MRIYKKRHHEGLKCTLVTIGKTKWTLKKVFGYMKQSGLPLIINESFGHEAQQVAG
ncbi:hypothetical protein ACT29H_00985 [Thermophagus sp. OGC60D27]|uniref:hypothetical protein n=1 Tax=Thermophagus sp. OGC60D27 TaxID=3458415 RepID=UPI0040384284